MKRYIIQIELTATEKNKAYYGTAEAKKTFYRHSLGTEIYGDMKWAAEHGYKTLSGAKSALRAEKDIDELEEMRGIWKREVNIVTVEF